MWRLVKRNLSSSLYVWSKKIVKTPSMGESITEGTLTQWHKKIGDIVKRDEQVATIETDKIDVQVNSPEPGKITSLYVKEGDTVSVGGNLLEVEVGEFPETLNSSSKPAESVSASAPKEATVSTLPVEKTVEASPESPIVGSGNTVSATPLKQVSTTEQKGSDLKDKEQPKNLGGRGETRVRL